MKRRRFISSVTIAFTGVALGTEVIFSSCNSDVKAEAFSAKDIELLDEIGETIIPATVSSPGAKAAKIGEFIKVYVMDCYSVDDREVFVEGLSSFRKSCLKKYKSDFFKLTISQKQELLKELDKKASEHTDARQKRLAETGDADAIQAGKTNTDKAKSLQNADHYFTMIRNLTLFGYFTSEPGATKALRYLQTPGYYAGEIRYKKGDKSWAI